MSHVYSHPLPSTGSLLKATGLATAVAALLLVTIVLPAEYGIDPTGIGRRLGLDALQGVPDKLPTDVANVVPVGDIPPNTLLAAKAEAAFGKNKGQSLDADAVSLSSGSLHRNTLTLMLEPGKGAEIKVRLKAGEGLVFRWTATGDVAVDMHGEQPEAKGTWTSYAVETAQREAAGTFVAPFDGTHGWYWQNRGSSPVTLEIETSGFQAELYQP